MADHEEIERKFLVVGDAWRTDALGVAYRQGYLALDHGVSVRVRAGGGHGFLTIKGPRRGITRDEFEYAIPAADASAMIDQLARGRVVEKTRYRIAIGDVVWEVDEFDGRNRGLVVAEVELRSEDQRFEPPSWIGEEVTEDPRYLNAQLALHPWRNWGRTP
jgi:CYTH domain-containing protein